MFCDKNIHCCLYCREADANRVREYNAAMRIQSWFRGIRLRAYVKYVRHQC